MANPFADILIRYPQLEILAPENLSARFEQLNPRERVIVLCALALLIVLPLFWIINSARGRIDRLQKQLDSAQTFYGDIDRLTLQYREQTDKSDRLMNKIRPASSFYLASYIESQAPRFQVALEELSQETRQDLGENLEEISVDVKISKISFRKMLELLTDLESSPMALMRLQRVRMKSNPADPSTLELHFKVSAYVRKSS